MKKIISLFSIKNGLLFIASFTGSIVIVFLTFTAVLNVVYFIQDPVTQFAVAEVIIPKVTADDYAYNEKAPKSVIMAEIDALAAQYGFSGALKARWIKTLECESQFNSLAKNPNSTALGLCQYLTGTWYETESFKKHHLSSQDVNACLSEMAQDIKAGETNKWSACW